MNTIFCLIFFERKITKKNNEEGSEFSDPDELYSEKGKKKWALAKCLCSYYHLCLGHTDAKHGQFWPFDLLHSYQLYINNYLI